MNAHFVCMAIGSLHRPKLPGIVGIDRFKGHSFHTSRWDFGYTGGDVNGDLVGLRGKRVGIWVLVLQQCSAVHSVPC
jgi:cyclohexanone monooxygenase